MLFEGKTLKEMQVELQEMTYIEHLEEVGKVSVESLDMNEVKKLQEVLTSLNYITTYENENLHVEEKRSVRVNEVSRKLIKNEGGSGGYTYRVSLPVDFIRELELEDDESVIVSLTDGSIAIRKER